MKAVKAGKLDSELLKEIVFNNLKTKREEVLVRPGIGEDCAVVDYGEYACVISTDPITGAASEVGRLAVHINCNDIASNGVEPLGLMLTILAPEGTTKEEIELIIQQASQEADQLGVEIIGGHTEITNAVNRVVISGTAIGKQEKSKIIKSAGAQVGDSIIMTKSAGLEGAGIIAYDKHDELKTVMTGDEIQTAQALLDQVSVVREGVIAGKYAVTSMHDVTEGGILGALWEVCEASKVGCRVQREAIRVENVTVKISEHYNIDPLKLISSGSMLITMKMNKKDALLKAFEASGIEACEIGVVTVSDKVIVENEYAQIIDPPESDELYKVV